MEVTAVPGDVSEDATADPVPFDEDVAVDVESPDARLVDVEAEPSEDDAATVAAPCAGHLGTPPHSKRPPARSRVSL